MAENKGIVINHYLKRNMGYPFPNIKIKVYSKTFLKDVHIGVLFPEVPLSDDLQKSAGEFFAAEFGLPNVLMGEMPKAVSVFSKDDKIRFSFGLSRLGLRIKREAYRSFEDIAPLLNKTYKYLGVMGCQVVDKIIFSKYNELAYEAKQETAVAEVMEGIFSADLLSSMTKRDRQVQKSLSRWEKVIHAKGDDDTDSFFTIEYGFIKKPEGVEGSSLTLKTLIESQKSEIPVSSIPRVLTDYNQVLDNAFHWCVSDIVLNEMKKK